MEKVLIYGLGKSGKAVIDSLLDRYEIYIFDDDISKANQMKEYYLDKVKILDSIEHNIQILKQLSFAVISPAISIYQNNIKIIKSYCEVIGELELSYRLGIKSLISVTGSNGKSTTVKLIEYIFILAGKYARAVGNIGEPMTSCYDSQPKNLINEVSSFQLETTSMFRTHIGVILNITPNHLDRHGDFKTYVATKLKMLDYADINIINYDDNILGNLKNKNTYYFSLTNKVKGAYVDKKGFLKLNLKGKNITLLHKEELKLKGEHNLKNAIASCVACVLAGIKLKYIKMGLRNFGGLKHRLNIVATHDGVTFVNDSKSTSIDSCLAAVNTFKNDMVLLLGGKNKNLNYIQMFKKFPQNVRDIIFYGETKNEMKNHYLQSGNTTSKLHVCVNLDEAIRKSISLSKDGDIVLLSPATSSFDEFSCFEERGIFFEKVVQRYVDEKKKNKI